MAQRTFKVLGRPINVCLSAGISGASIRPKNKENYFIEQKKNASIATMGAIYALMAMPSILHPFISIGFCMITINQMDWINFKHS